MTDLSKITGKFDLQKIIDDVKSVITPPPIPEASKDDPIGYRLSELNKLAKELAETHTKQADSIAKLNVELGELYKEISKKGLTQAKPEVAAADSKPEYNK